jgi:hypothetical protein
VSASFSPRQNDVVGQDSAVTGWSASMAGDGEDHGDGASVVVGDGAVVVVVVEVAPAAGRTGP